MPVVTTGDPAQGFLAGAIGRPGTQVLLGNHDIDFGAFSGGRATLGGWLDRNHTFGIEGSGFLLQQKSATFAAISGPNSLPVLAVPFSNQFSTFGFVGAGPVGENVFQAASSAIPSSGSILVTNSVRLWGSEANGVLSLLRGKSFRLEALAGFRYLDLQEDFDLALSTTTTTRASIGPFPPTGQIFDHFGTHNQFFGGQLGLRGSFNAGRWFFEGSAKVALGDNHQSVNINGELIDSGRGFWFFRDNSGNFPGGIFAQTSNSGRRTREQFAVIPEFDAKIGYDLTTHVALDRGLRFSISQQRRSTREPNRPRRESLPKLRRPPRWPSQSGAAIQQLNLLGPRRELRVGVSVLNGPCAVQIRAGSPGIDACRGG